MTQRQQVLHHLRNYGSLTPREAFLEYGIQRLAARIHELRSDGHDIQTQMTTVHTRSGDTTEVAKYVLQGQGQLSF